MRRDDPHLAALGCAEVLSPLEGAIVAKKKTLKRKPEEDYMSFTIDVRVKTKKDSHDVLLDLIARAEKALTSPKHVQVVDIRGVVSDPIAGDA